ncbi:MAG: hypothetical protein HY699_17105 [Deltaproteobacteria bacterium]|nr:hypothetical protein [Deltaproteobacteria bacterium]
MDVAAGFRDLLRAFADHDVRFLIVGAYALAVFARAWPRRLRATFDDVSVAVLGRADFLANKRATGRLQDLADAERLVRTRRRRKPTRRTP